VFKRTAGTGTWTFIERLKMPDSTWELAQAGCSVAIDPVTKDIVVGAWGSNTVASFGGAAFVYKKGSGDTWGDAANATRYGGLTRVPSQVLAPEDLQAIDQFGFSVAIHGGTIAVGCPLSGNSNTGAIYTFDRDADGVYQPKAKLLDDAAGANDQLGTKVAINGDILVAGIQNDDIQGRLNAGSAIVWTRSSGTWTAGEKLTAASPAASVGFGSSVAVLDGGAGSTSWLVVGEPLRASGASTPVGGNGTAYVYSSLDNGKTWALDGTLLPRRDNLNNNFGYAVAMSATNPPQIVVGAPGVDTAYPDPVDNTRWVQVVNPGAGFAFSRRGAGTWAIRGTGPVTGDLWGTDVVANSSIGRAVAIAPTATTYSIVSAETPTSSLGSAFPFEYRLALVGSAAGNVSGPALGQLGADGKPTDGSTPGTGDGGTGGAISGGGSPGTGITSGPGAIVIPLAPIVQPWGTIKGSAVALKGRGVHLLQTDGKFKGVQPQWRYLKDLPVGARYVGTGDLTGDKSGDIVFVDKGEVLRFWKRDAFKVLETDTIDTLPLGYDAIKVGDFDGNGQQDIVLRSILHPREIELWNISGGSIASIVDYELPAGDWLVIPGTFRSKTSNDLLIRDRKTGVLRVVVPDSNASGGATFPFVARQDPSYRIAGFGDVDGNGQVDIFWQGKDVRISQIAQDDKGNYVVSATHRVGFSEATIVNIRDWNDDGTLDFWMKRGKHNYVQYGKFVKGYMYGGGSRDFGDAPGAVVDISER
jgi:hypothetical protein